MWVIKASASSALLIDNTESNTKAQRITEPLIHKGVLFVIK